MDAPLETVVESLDRRLGSAIGRAVRAHHRKRLHRHGWDKALGAEGHAWARADPPARSGCELEVLIDGAEALPCMAAELAQAQSHVHITGWHLSPDFALTRDGQPTIVRNLLADLASRVDVRVLLWAGAPLPAFRPSRASVREVRERMCKGTRIRCALDAHERPLHCHHEKTIVVDDRVAFVGGIDLTHESGDRFDSSDHQARGRIGWHDVAALVRGPAVPDVADHFRLRWHEVTGESLPRTGPPSAVGDVEVQIVRTVPDGIYGALPHGDFRVLESYVGAIRGAREFVYLESQFLWSPEVTSLLRDKLLNPPSDDFRLLVVLPAHPTTGGDDTRGALGELAEADDGNGRLLACTLYARHGPFSDPVYVHSKTAIVDDAWLTIGSANLNDHSLFNDTELNVVTHDATLARETRLRLWAEHLELAPTALEGSPATLIDEIWRPVSDEQLDRLTSGRPLSHRLVRLPHVSRRSERLLGPLQGLLVDG